MKVLDQALTEGQAGIGIYRRLAGERVSKLHVWTESHQRTIVVSDHRTSQAGLIV